MTNIPLKEFTMIRHGKTTADNDEKLTGITDVELSDHGKSEAQAAKEILSGYKNKPNVIIHSKLTRAKQTAEIINQSLKLEMIEHPEIHEQDFGDWEEKGIGLYIESYNARGNPPNGETFDDFDERIRGALSDILNQHDNPLIVCHGGVFRSFYSIYRQGHFLVDNAMPYDFEPNHENDVFPWRIIPIR